MTDRTSIENEAGYGEATDDVFVELYDAIEKRIPGTFAQNHQVIFHYTDLEGLLGILQSRGFWLSDARFMNDSEELLNGRRIAAAVMAERIAGMPDDGYRQAVVEAKRRIDHNAVEKVYFSSFCLDGDLLEQWRAYAINGKGVSLGFDLTGGNLSRFFQKLPALSMHKVIYDDARKREIVEIVLESYGKSFAQRPGGRPRDDVIEEYCGELVGMLNYFSCFFKNNAFATEKEVRLVATGDVSTRFDKLHFRVSKGSVVPYVCTNELAIGRRERPVGPENLPVRQVIVGPTSNQDMMAAGLREFFRHNGYDPALVVKSKVPYRG